MALSGESGFWKQILFYIPTRQRAPQSVREFFGVSATELVVCCFISNQNAIDHVIVTDGSNEQQRTYRTGYGLHIAYNMKVS